MPQLDEEWEPGRTMKPYEIYNDEHKIFNDAIYNKLVAALDDLELSTEEESRSELDSHVNMAVIGKHALHTCRDRENGGSQPIHPNLQAYKGTHSGCCLAI